MITKFTLIFNRAKAGIPVRVLFSYNDARGVRYTIYSAAIGLGGGNMNQVDLRISSPYNTLAYQG